MLDAKIGTGAYHFEFDVYRVPTFILYNMIKFYERSVLQTAIILYVIIKFNEFRSGR